MVKAIEKSSWKWKVTCSYISIAGGRLYHLNIGEEGRRLTHIAVHEKGECAWEAIEKLLSSNNKTSRLWAISFFGQHPRPRTPKKVLPLLKEQDEDIVQAAVEALRDMKAKAAVEPLRRVMIGKHTLITRMCAAWALGILGEKEAVSFFVGVLANQNLTERRCARRCLEILFGDLSRETKDREWVAWWGANRDRSQWDEKTEQFVLR